jgi:integrase
VNGMIRQRSRGSWQVTVEVGQNPQTGKRVRHTTTVRGTRREAERLQAELIHSLNTGSFFAPTKETVATFTQRWLREYAIPNLAPRTVERYEEIIRLYVVPSLGSIRLAQLKPAHIARAETAWRERGLSSSTVLKHHRLLHTVLEHAVRWQVCGANVARAVSPPRPQRKEMTVLDERQAAALVRAARGTEYEEAIVTALFTGLRLGELRGLRWKDVDLTRGHLHLQQTIQRLRGGALVTQAPKTHRSRRQVSLSQSTILRLRRHRAVQNEGRLLAGAAWNDQDLVFADDSGYPLHESRLRQALHNLLKEAELPRLRWHDLRHSMASVMLALGEHPKVVQERLGHTTVGVTLDTYSHLLPGLQDAAAERLAAALCSSETSRIDPLS